MWDLPGPGLEPHVPCIDRQILNHCTTREAQTVCVEYLLASTHTVLLILFNALAMDGLFHNILLL